MEIRVGKVHVTAGTKYSADDLVKFYLRAKKRCSRQNAPLFQCYTLTEKRQVFGILLR